MARTSTSGIDTRRLYRRFLLLVMLPTTCLVALGVLAIHNERAAVEQRLTEQYANRLRLLAGHLATLLETTADEFAKGTAGGNDAIIRYWFSYKDRSLTLSRPISRKTEEALIAGLDSVAAPSNGSMVLLPIVMGPARGLYAVRLHANGSLVGIAFSEPGLSTSITKEAEFLFPWDPAHYSLLGPQDSPVPLVGPLRSMLENMAPDQIETGALSLPLPGTLSDWRVVAELSGSDPVRTMLLRNQVIYILTLVFCSVIITIGAFTTLRGMWIESRLSRLRTDFVSNISHEIRTPLTSIRMFADTLRSGRATTAEEQAACIEFIANESERLSALAERTLDWARIEAGRQQYQLRPVPFAQVASEVVDTYLARGTVPREWVDVEIDPTVSQVNGDPSALSQVLLNLLENAVKYTGTEKRITVRLYQNGRSILLEVEDNGVGIARKDQKRIFERFFRADDLLARQTEGTGLGLSIARRIVEAHHGRLTLRSEVGRGSVFTVQLPAVMSNTPTPVESKEHLA